MRLLGTDLCVSLGDGGQTTQLRSGSGVQTCALIGMLSSLGLIFMENLHEKAFLASRKKLNIEEKLQWMLISHTEKPL